jgi:hypothetical protein
MNDAGFKRAWPFIWPIPTILITIWIYSSFPETQKYLGYVFGTYFAFKFIEIAVEHALQKVTKTLQEQSYTNTRRIEEIEQKVSVILRKIAFSQRPPGT